MKGLIAFFHCNSYFFLPQIQFNKLPQLHISPQWILKAKDTHHSKKTSYKPGGTQIQKKHFLLLKNTGLIIEERMWRMIVPTREHAYCLGEEGNQCRVKKRGEIRMKEKFEIAIPQILIFTIIQHTLSPLHSLVIYLIYAHTLNTLWQGCSAPTIHDSIG